MSMFGNKQVQLKRPVSMERRRQFADAEPSESSERISIAFLTKVVNEIISKRDLSDFDKVCAILELFKTFESSELSIRTLTRATGCDKWLKTLDKGLSQVYEYKALIGELKTNKNLSTNQ